MPTMDAMLCQTCGVLRRLPHWCGPANLTRDLLGPASRTANGVQVPIMYNVWGEAVPT